jgi:hypothetical protein
MLCLRKQQKDDEDGAVEEMDTSDEEQEAEEEEEEQDDDDEEDDENSESEHRNEIGCCDEREDQNKGSGNCSPSTKKRKHVGGKEKDLLREEFVSNMYRSFLEGRDEDFDYRLVIWK